MPAASIGNHGNYEPDPYYCGFGLMFRCETLSVPVMRRVLGVRQGKRFEVELDGPADEDAVTAVTELARDLLSNPVIEEFTLHVG